MLSRFVVLFVNLRTIYGADNNALPAKSGGRTLFPIIKIGLYDCPEMLFRGSYSLLPILLFLELASLRVGTFF